MSNRGGKRKGAGRTPTGQAKIKASVSIDPDLHVWAKENKINVSRVTNNALKVAKAEMETTERAENEGSH